MMKYLSYRAINIYGFLLVILLMIGAAHLQYNLGIAPCPLCIIQRLLFLCIGFSFFLGMMYNPPPLSRLIHHSVTLTFSLTGLMVSLWHIYLQYLGPKTTTSCGPGLHFLLKNLPTWEALVMIFKGSGNCAMVHWRWLGLSIPEWSSVFFVIFTAMALRLMLSKKI